MQVFLSFETNDKNSTEWLLTETVLSSISRNNATICFLKNGIHFAMSHGKLLLLANTRRVIVHFKMRGGGFSCQHFNLVISYNNQIQACWETVQTEQSISSLIWHRSGNGCLPLHWRIIRFYTRSFIFIFIRIHLHW